MKYKKSLSLFFSSLFLVLCLLFFWEVYVPKTFGYEQTIIYTANRGMGDEDIARELKKQGIIKSSIFFKLYDIISGSHSKLQAGKYELSSSMSIAEIIKRFVLGDIVKDKITIVEGWDLKDIAEYLETKKLYSQKDFLDLTSAKGKDWCQDQSTEISKKFSARPSNQQIECPGFEFLKDKPKNSSLEGYVFPDTYETFTDQKPEELLKNILVNFDKKLTDDLRKEISLQKKSIFEIVTMASIIEKEVKSLDDKKIVSGILWKRLENKIPLQVDATINYITGKNDARAAIKDTKIDSPYNTYKYIALPLGPISNPGMDSILAVIYPTKSDYWYYLSADGNGKTIFSKTLDEHNIAKANYLKP